MKSLWIVILSTLVSVELSAAQWSPQPRWAALAAASRSNRIGRAHSEPTEYDAKDGAIRACGANDCEIKAYVFRGCISLARGAQIYPTPMEWVGAGAAKWSDSSHLSAPDQIRSVQRQAQDMAITMCDAVTHSKTCQLTETFCTWDNELNQEEYSLNHWIMNNGGEAALQLRNLVLFANRAAYGYLLDIGLSSDHARCIRSSRWNRVSQLANQCRLSLFELERILFEANRYLPNS